MGKSLIITEKPSVAQEFAKVLRVSGRNDGYIENGEYVISWCVGHLVGLVYPESYDMKYKKWRLEDLPFLPKEYKYDVIDSVRKQYNIVHALLQREEIDRVYWAGDAGKEGQTTGDLRMQENIEAEWKAVEGSKYFESPLCIRKRILKAGVCGKLNCRTFREKTAVVSSIERGTSRKKADHFFFNLAELQVLSVRSAFKISPDETLQVAQDLYGEKTDYLSKNGCACSLNGSGKRNRKNISRLKGYEPVQGYVERITEGGDFITTLRRPVYG